MAYAMSRVNSIWVRYLGGYDVPSHICRDSSFTVDAVYRDLYVGLGYYGGCDVHRLLYEY